MADSINTQDVQKDEEQKRYNKFALLGIFLASWTIVLFFGILIFFLAMFMTSGVILDINPGVEDVLGTFLLIYGIAASVIIWLTRNLLRRFKNKLFFKFAGIALFLGFYLNVLVGLIGFGVLVANGVNYATVNTASSGTICYGTAEEQIGRALSATVPIATNNNQFGTGFVISKDGRVLTAYHVIEGASEYYLNTTTGKQPLRLVESAPEYDLALLESDNTFPVFTHLTGRYGIADDVYAIGYPGNTFDAGQASVSGGIVSRVISPSDLKLNGHENMGSLSFVQTDAAVNGGNSGGPLVGRCGVVGVVNLKSDRMQLGEYGIVSEEGISFAVSSQSIAARFGLTIHD